MDFPTRISHGLAVLLVAWTMPAAGASPQPVDFNRDIRPILANTCFACHGPDEKERKAGLRLDTRDGALADRDGTRAVVPGDPDASELLARITTSDPGDRMPPPKSGKKLTPAEVRKLGAWIEQGAPFAAHWSYVQPQTPEVPDVAALLRSHGPAAGATADGTAAAPDHAPPLDPAALLGWPKNEIDTFVLRRLLEEGLRPSPEADRHALIRRVFLDLTGLPPTVEEVDRFVQDDRAGAYDRLVDRLLASDAYGEHWARMWLDLARYADSAGYADDPPRVIWGYRDWVIRAFNDNMPFDRFTIAQIAGDLLPEASKSQLIATAFHRNTQTNNEGGTNDEEFRNVAVVDRVNTTMATWMGTTMACAQCHSHKYDPISQEEYFRFYAIFNNSQDADRRNESPTVQFYSEAQQRQKAEWEAQVAALEKVLATPTPELRASQTKWEMVFPLDLAWQSAAPAGVRSKAGAAVSVRDDGAVAVEAKGETDVYTVEVPLTAEALSAVRLTALSDPSLPGGGPGHGPEGRFVVSQVSASIVPPEASSPAGRFVRVELPGKQKILSLAEVQVFSQGKNVAEEGTASQSSTDYDGPAKLAIDGNTDGNYNVMSTTHTASSNDPWWEVDLGGNVPIERIVVWNRTDGNVGPRLEGFVVRLLDDERRPVWQSGPQKAPASHLPLDPSGVRPVPFTAAVADVTQAGFDAASVIDAKAGRQKGWSTDGRPGDLTLLAAKPVPVPEGSRLRVVIEQASKHKGHTLARFRIGATHHAGAEEWTRTPPEVIRALSIPPERRSEAETSRLIDYFLRDVAPELADQRKRLAALRKQLSALKPFTVPVMRERPEDQRRTTNIQHRGNFLDTGAEVTPGVPAAFHPLSPADDDAAGSGEAVTPDRLALARWLVDEENPLTARVTVNRYWEKLFGTGLVATSEEFGAQGELPSHPDLLDWLATRFMAEGWDIKALLKVIVTSATYRQSSRVTPALFDRDPDNRLFARGPRFRLSAEMIRDQALFVSGLLSRRMYGPPVKPPQPSLGLSAAFGSGIDWKTSDGEDRYRRGLYTTWRRSSPYPSMATFDAPNREVCTVRRARTNTPLQALVTLNDPVYVEAAQALGRRMAAGGSTPQEKARYGFRLCLARRPSETELARLVQLYEDAYAVYARSPQQARQMATEPLGDLPEGADAAELAAWTVVGNVLLNLDEMFMKR